MYASHLRLAVVLVFALCGFAAAQSDHDLDAYRAAHDHYKSGRWELAEQELTRFLAGQPQRDQAASARFLLAECHMQQHTYDAAREHFLQYLNDHPGHRYAKHAMFRAGEAAYLSGRTKIANDQLLQFHTKYPDDALNEYVLNYLGNSALAAHDGAQGQAYYRDALRSFPAGTLSTENRYGLARCLEIQGMTEAARREYRQLSREGGLTAVDAQLQLGISCYTDGIYEEAAVEFEQAVVQSGNGPRTVQARYWLGTTRMAQGRWSEARTALETAVTKHSEHSLVPEMTYWLAEACRRNEEPQTAAVYYERILSQWPDSTWADESLAALIDYALTRGDFEQVDSLADTFTRRYSDSPLLARTMQFVGRSLLKRERFDEAIRVLRDATREASPADDDSTDVPVIGREAFADQQTAWYYLAVAHLGKEDGDAALEALRHIDLQTANDELRSGVQVAQATALISLKRYVDAIDPLQSYVKQQPDGPEAARCRLQLIVALAATGRLENTHELLAELDESSRQHPLYWQSVHAVAEAAYEATQYETAASLFRILTNDHAPQEFAARGWSGLGWISYQRGDYAAALTAFGHLSSEFPDNGLAIEARMMVAKSQERLGEHQLALENYLAVVSQYADSEHAASALFEAARLHETLGDKPAALSLVETLTRSYPTFAQRDAALYQQAWLLSDLQRAAEADRVFSRIHLDYPTSRYWADCTYRLAERALQAGQYDRAIQLNQTLLEQPNVNPEILSHAYYLKGQLAASTGHWDEVALPLEQLLEKFPESPLGLPATYWIAESHFRQDDFERAGIAFDQLALKIRDERDSWVAMIPLRRSQILLRQEKWREALEIAEKIAERYPGFRQQYEADYVIGRCLAMQGKLDQARECYERVIRSAQGGQTETAAMAQWMIGESYMHQKDHAEAIRAFHRVESLFGYPRWQAAALLQAGKCYELEGRWEDATRAFSRLVETYPETTFANEASQRLKYLGPQQNQTARY